MYIVLFTHTVSTYHSFALLLEVIQRSHKREVGHLMWPTQSSDRG